MIYNEDCKDTMRKMSSATVDVILTSPFYNTNKKAGKRSTLENTVTQKGDYPWTRYDCHVDNMTENEYDNYTVDLFLWFDKILKPNGVVLYNMSYGNENTNGMISAVDSVLKKTPFALADIIVWKKKNALPNNCSRNRLTRIVEFVYVFCRASESGTFYTNKKVTSVRSNGQKMYENIFNFVEAANNDGSCNLNKATYSSELCEKLLTIYCPHNGHVYDPFMGTGTTAVACERLRLQWTGSEISAKQVEYANERIKKGKMSNEEPLQSNSSRY